MYEYGLVFSSPFCFCIFIMRLQGYEKAKLLMVINIK